MPVFTRQELEQFNGQNGAPVYVAWSGSVYDVSQSYHWRKGSHWTVHSAGLDLTEELRQAPHGPDLLNKFPIVGTIREDPTK